MFDNSEFSKEAESKKVLRKRSSTLLIILFLIALISLSQIFKLTIFDKDRYLTDSEENRITIVPINNSRGLIRLSDELKVAYCNIKIRMPVNFKNIRYATARMRLGVEFTR